MKIYHKITLGSLFIIMLFTIFGIMEIISTKNTAKVFDELKSDIVPGAIVMTEMANYTNEIHLCLMEYILEGEYETREEMQKTMQLLENAAIEHTEYKAHIGDEDKKEAKELEEKVKKVNSLALELIDLKDQGLSTKKVLEKEEELEFHPSVLALLEQLNGHKKIYLKELEDTGNNLATMQFNTLKKIYISIIIILILSLSARFMIIRSIPRPIIKLRSWASDIGKGKLNTFFELKSKDEIGELARTFMELQKNLQEKTEIAKKVAEGDFSVSVEPKSNEDVLAISLNDMTNSLDKLKKSLSENEERTKMILNSIQAGVVMIDAETHIIEYVNPTAAKMIGVTEDNILGKICHDFICPAEKGKCPITDLGQDVDNSERIVLKANSKKINVLKTVTPITINERKLLLETFVDITESKKIAKALQENEKRFKGFAFSMADWLWEVNADGIYTYCSENIKKIIGCTAKEILGKTPFDLMTAEEAERIGKIFTEAQSKGKSIKDLKNWHIHKNGKLVCLLTNAVPIFDDEGNHLGYRGVDKDITEQIHSEEELKKRSEEIEKQSRLKSAQNKLNEKMRGELDVLVISKNIISFLAKLLNAQMGAIYLFDEEKENLKICGTYAFSKRKNLNDTIEIGEGLAGQAAYEKEMIAISNLPENYFNISSGTGKAIPRNVVVVPFTFENKLIGVIELASFNKFTNEQLDFLNAVAENIAIGIITALSRTKMKVLLEKTQQQAEELQTQQEELKIANQELEEQTEELKTNSEKLKDQQEELQAANEELEEKTESLKRQGSEITKKNEDLEKAGKLLEKKAKDLAISSKYKSEFLANMSHELRTPLNSLLILARDLSENRKGNLDDKQIEASGIIYNSGNDLLNLINEILDLSKVEAGKMTTNIQYIPLKDVANNLKTLFTHQIEQKGLEFNIILSNELPETILTDQQRLEQIIKNLISNAIKFTSKGGITINFKRPDETADLSRSGLDFRKAVAVSVSDTGIGIPKEKQAAIFEAFQQADGSTSRKYGGTGLGLSISKELSTLLGGELQLESIEGKGSTFTAFISEEMKEKWEDTKSMDRREIPDRRVEKEIPTIEEIKERIPAPSIDDDRKNINKDDRTILIVEDDLNFARTLKRFCKENNFKFIHSGDGETGLILAEKYLPQAIILDIKLPGIDGWTVLDKLKEDKQLRHIPVHIMSVYEESAKALNKGAIGYLTKPVSADQINNAFNNIESFISKEIKDLLIVENDDNIRKSILKLIDNENVKITTKKDGKTALNILKKEKFDCMILDLELPEISGFEVLKKMKSLKDNNVPPTIIYTGKEITQEEEYELHKNANSIIIKGVKSEERLLDETALFLHQVVNKLPKKDQKIISMLHDKDDLFKGKKILVVDDDMRNVFAISSILEDREMIISTASNGEKAVEALENEPDIDLVLMDIMMPVMDGYEAMKRIRAQKKFAALPIIALTAKAMKGDKEKCIAAGASDYLSKPLDIDKVLSLLRVWLYK